MDAERIQRFQLLFGMSDPAAVQSTLEQLTKEAQTRGASIALYLRNLKRQAKLRQQRWFNRRKARRRVRAGRQR